MVLTFCRCSLVISFYFYVLMRFIVNKNISKWLAKMGRR